MKKKPFVQIICGLLLSFGVWLSGILLSGRILFVEEMELYQAGPLVLLFLPVYVFACVFASKYALKNQSKAFYASAIAGLVFPAVTAVACILLDPLYGDTVLFQIVSAIIFGFSIFSIPINSVFVQLISLGSEPYTEKVLVVLGAAVMLSGLIASVVIYKREQKRRQITDNT